MKCKNCQEEIGECNECPYCGFIAKDTQQKAEMGWKNNIQKSTASAVYDKARKYLKEKDGKQHIIMFNSFSKFLNQTFECEDKYTIQIDEILSGMQTDGYEILDIKFNSIQSQGLFGEMEGFHTLIIYK